MLIGVPKEIKNHEYRVGMTPESVAEAIRHGHQVIVEKNEMITCLELLLKAEEYVVYDTFTKEKLN